LFMQGWIEKLRMIGVLDCWMIGLRVRFFSNTPVIQTSGTDWVADIGIDAILKVAKTKSDTSYASSIKSVVKSVIGTCVSLGIKIEGKTPKEITAEINDGKWDKKFQ